MLEDDDRNDATAVGDVSRRSSTLNAIALSNGKHWPSSKAVSYDVSLS